MKITKQDIINFETDIAGIFAQGIIKAPVHLRSGREEQLIDIFTNHGIGSDDYVFGYWDSHELALLKGVPATQVKDSILAGNSIALSFPDFRVLCSGIVGSLVGVAVGVAWALKQQGKPGRVFHFCGEMSAETGIFHEAVKYATNFDLPIKFVVCDNGVSVMTNTREVWGQTKQFDGPWFKDDILETTFSDKIIYFKYTNGYPHSGLGKLIKF
jgi:TPP-dependent pyruvate/acetoin dehydrogenase alpha subunit